MVRFCFLIAFFFSSHAHGLSAMDFLKGDNESFNKVFVRKFITQAVEKFGKRPMTQDFTDELDFFIENESDQLFLNHEGQSFKHPKFFLRFKINQDGVKRSELGFVSSQKKLSLWDLKTFEKRGALSTQSLSNECKPSDESLFFEKRAGEGCTTYTTESTKEHPAFRGFLRVESKNEKKTIVAVKYLLVGMVKFQIPSDVKDFALLWRTPPSRYNNHEEYSEVYLP